MGESNHLILFRVTFDDNGGRLPIEIKPVLNPVLRPVSLDSLCALLRSDAESAEREDERPNAYARLSRRAGRPALGAAKTGGTICPSDRICGSIASSLSRNSIDAGNDVGEFQSRPSLASISGYTTGLRNGSMAAAATIMFLAS